MELDQYISEIKAKLNSSLIVSSIDIVDERVLFDRGYFRARLTLVNQDFLEIAESFTLQDEQLVTLDYRYQLNLFKSGLVSRLVCCKFKQKGQG
ncbi:hypothetical protein [Leptolyngbya sp. NIES-2104]|uniref:hypothetical protein n=1 Tax=Leptolyngbya sp. NIES-2104 TaxID=1552121 RepID=UPI0012E345D9|nr:hypothetical protein [Leptolyngbya sp. NIES-2104]